MELPTLGLIRGMPADEYHAAPGISQSGLKTFAGLGGPAKYKAGVRKDSPSLKFGGIFHTATLEPHLLDQQYCPTDVKREAKKAWAEAEAKAPGRVLVTRKDWDKARRMRDAVQGHRTARQFITADLETESSFFWADPRTGMLCRGRADGICRRRNAVVDLKSCVDASPEGFAKSVSEWGYDWQEYFYRVGLWHADDLDIGQFIFVAVEKDAPHLTACYTIEPHCIADARFGVEQAMRDLKRCRDADKEHPDRDNWPGYDEGILPLNVRHSPRRKLPEGVE